MSDLVPFTRGRWNPFRRTEEDDWAWSSFDRMVSDLVSDFEKMFTGSAYESAEGNVVYEIEVPGFNKDNLKVEVSDGLLTVSGTREKGSRKSAGQEKIFKQLKIGDAEIEIARVEDGILKLTFKMPETVKTRIEVE